MATSILVFIEKDLPNLIKLIKEHFPTVNLKVVYKKENLLREIDEFEPHFIIAQLYKQSDLELVKHITSTNKLIIISESLEQDLAVKFLQHNIVDWILFDYLDRLSVTLKLLSEKKVINRPCSENLKMFLNVIENLSEFAVMVDPEGKIIVCNRTFKQNFKDPETIKGKSILSFISFEDREKFTQALRKSTANNFFEIPELKLDINGKEIITSVVGHGIHNDSGKIENYVCLLYNITEKKHYEYQLKESEQLFRKIADTAIFSVFIYQENKFVYVNPAALEVSGYSYDELMKMNFWDIIHPDFKDLVRERGIRRLRGEDVPSRYEFKIIRKDNTERWIDFNASFLEYKGKPAALGIALDITEKKLADDLLKSSHDFYLKLFNEFPALLWRTDVNGNLIFFNKTWLNFRGKDLEQEINDGWQKDIHPDDITFVVNDFKRYFSERKAFEMEYRIKNTEGAYRWVFIKGCPFYDANNQFAGFIGSGYDITEKKEYEEKISNLNEELKLKIKNLEDFKSIAVERELKMIELKEMIKQLQSKQQ